MFIRIQLSSGAKEKLIINKSRIFSIFTCRVSNEVFIQGKIYVRYYRSNSIVSTFCVNCFDELELLKTLSSNIVEDNNFQMVVYTGEICEKIRGSEDIDMPYFHFKPDMTLHDFLTEYGLAGGTHHIAMTRGDKKKEVEKLAELLQLNIVILG